MAAFFPPIGQWYQDAVTNQVFEVVAVDERSSTIEVQYHDGDLTEFDVESWGQLNLLPAEPPEDGNAGYGFAGEDYWSDSDTSFPGGMMSNPLDSIEPDSFTGFDDF